MKKAKISFRAVGGSGPLTLSWFDGPKGKAVEAHNEIGVGFFSSDGTLLCVEFDDVDENHAEQTLEFDRYQVKATVNQGKVVYSVIELTSSKRKSQRTKKQGNDAA